MEQRTRVGVVRWIGAILIASAVSGCGGSGDASRSVPKPAATATPYGITAHVEVAGHPEQSGWVRVPPVDWNSWGTEADIYKQLNDQSTTQTAPGPTSQSISAPPRHVEATVQKGDGGVTDTFAEDQTLNNAPGWSLLNWATLACFDPFNGTVEEGILHLQTGLRVDRLPWRSQTPDGLLRNYYNFAEDFSGNPDSQSCDIQLVMQETLLCAADHLAQLGDSPGTVTWSGSDGTGSGPVTTVTIPPQRSDDIFIARDMALNALAHLLRLDTRVRGFSQNTHTQAGSVGFQATCIDEYAAGPPDSDVPGVFLLDSTYLDPPNTFFDFSSADQSKAAGMRRLARKANLLTSAARLTKDLVERSVQQDISGAQQRLSASTDALAGARLAWGADPGGDPYNTLHHALRTLFGRLEIGNNSDPVSGEGNSFLDWIPHQVTRDDPKCGTTFGVNGELVGNGFTALDAFSVLSQASGVSARWDAVPPKTKGQALALSILDHAGIIAGSRLVQAVGAAPVGAAIRSTLRDDAAQRAGFSSTSAFLATDAGQSAAALFQSLPNDDLTFALQRVFDAFRLITEIREEFGNDPATEPARLRSKAEAAGLTVRDDVPAITAIGGIVLDGGLPRDELSVDPLASLSWLQDLSSCGTFSRAVGSFGEAQTDLQEALGPRGGDVTVFQNPFLMAEGFRRQLAALAQAAANVSATDVSTFASLSAAEVRQWAGPGTLLTEDPGGETSENLYLVNISPQDLGADSTPELGDRLILVSTALTDSSFAANCLAGLRHHCPAGLVPPMPGTPTSSPFYRQVTAPPEPVDLSAVLSVGLDHQTIKLSYPYPSSNSTSGSYVVLLPLNGKPGQVLGWVRTPDANTEFFAESYSREQRDLAAQVFGIGRTTEPDRSCANVAPLTLARDYCIAGMKRDQFVPLANELNSTGMSTSVDDSWKNYLDLATAAADKADQLGVQLIQQGLDKDLRKESATEDLGNLCGSYISVDNVTAVGGDVQPPTGDSQLTQCVNGPTTDIVYLRDDPFVPSKVTLDQCKGQPDEGPNDACQQAISNQIRSLYCTGASSAPPFCARNGLVTHAGLGFKTGSAKPVDADIAGACQDIHEALPTLVGGGQDSGGQVDKANFGNASAEPWATNQGLANTLQGLRLDERANGQWTLSVGSRIIMGSDALISTKVAAEARGDVWPYCTSLPAPPPAPGSTAPQPPNGCTSLGNLVKDLFPPLLAPSDPTHAELRSQLEATIFYMGALAGELPAGVIRMPVPVANRSTSALANEIIPAPVLYSQSYFKTSGKETATDPRNLDPTVLKDLYVITDQDPTTGKKYNGALPWDNQEFAAMKPARTFQTPAELAYVLSREPNPGQTSWRFAVYAQAHEGNYLYVDTTNAPLEFDPSLVAGASTDQHFGRDTLQAWLTSRADEFNAGDASFLDHVVQATYLTAPGKKPDDTKPPPPYRVCTVATPARGRNVCTGAPVSPTFYYAYGVADTCDGAQVGGLEATIYANSHTDCWTGIQARATPFKVTVPPGDHCSGGTGASALVIRPSHDGKSWFSPWVAAGTKPDSSVFSWNVGFSGFDVPTENACGTPFFGNSITVDTSCPSYDWTEGWGAATSRGIWQDRLKPSFCPPEQRLELFLENTLQDRLDASNTVIAPANVVAMQTLVRALGLSCVFSNQHVGIRLKDLPPPITNVEDINVLESWLNLFGFDVDQIANVLYLVDVPSDVVSIAQNGSSDVGAVTSGERGKIVLDLESKLSLLENGFSSIGSTFQQLADAIRKARVDIQAAQLASTSQTLTVAAAMIDNDRQRSLAYLNAVAGYAKLAVGALEADSFGSLLSNGAQAVNEMIDASVQIGTSGIDLVALDASDANLVQKQQNIDAMGQNSEAQAVIALSQSTTSLYQAVNDNITGLKTNNNGALQDIDDLKQTASKASIDLAKASGADFMSINGKDVPDQVNTVYRRQFDLTKQRYQLALDSAKRTAYLARLSIEQRLGVRLDELHQNIGPLEAPATWVDDLCTVQGVDYNKLSTATPGVDATSQTEFNTVKGFANQFIGSYVDKLRAFVQFYNVQFPFVDSNDVAVVSLREDLPGSLTQCIVPSPNLVLYSDALDANSPDVSSANMISHGGWRVTQCDAGACLRVQTGGVLLNSITGGTQSVLIPPGGDGRATLLSTIAQPLESVAEAAMGLNGAAGAPDADAATPPPSPAPPAAVFQTIRLQSGNNYVLSWWDMSRKSDGTPVTDPGTSRPYAVSIFDANWSLVAGDSFAPAPSVDGVTWSERHTLQAVATSDGDYHIVFTAGPPGNVGAAVAIANVQLENGSGNGGGPSAYESNGATTLHATGRCNVDTPDQFRSRFSRKCDNQGCFFELNDVLAIDTQLLNQRSSSLIGKLAPGNYNYRNNTVAVNVVGTGVIDCSHATGPSCNGSAYVQYDLDDVAYNVPLDDYEGNIRCFDFGAGSVKSGKALASERFITLPMNSADRDLIDQSPFLKPEFSGRPLSGSYRLRIHDEPQLVWKNVDDIQIVMNYGYWSRVARSPGN